jgi:hypothetical protein
LLRVDSDIYKKDTDERLVVSRLYIYSCRYKALRGLHLHWKKSGVDKLCEIWNLTRVSARINKSPLLILALTLNLTLERSAKSSCSPRQFLEIDRPLPLAFILGLVSHGKSDRKALHFPIKI